MNGISVKVEKEIKQENHVIGRFTVRQVAFLGVALILEGLFYLIVRPEIELFMGIGMILGVIAWYFGFHKKNGIPVEYFLLKKIKQMCLRNYQRRYKSRNKYIVMLNAYYEKKRILDLSDRQKARIIKKRNKRRNKSRQKIKAYE